MGVLGIGNLFHVIENVVTQKTIISQFVGLKNNEVKLLFCTFVDQFMIGPIFFFVEEQLLELQTVGDLEIILEKGNFLKEDEDRYIFRKTLEIIGRIDLVQKFEIYVAAGNL